jgi:hypothetical protein
MKTQMKNFALASLAVLAFLGAAVKGNSQTTVSVDPTRTWVGYMNVFSPDFSTYYFGSPWGTAALSAYFDATGTNSLTLTANTNCYNPADSYWANPDGTGAKMMDASFYVQDDTLAGQTLTFNGTCKSNSLASGYNSTAFIKVFAPDYSSYYGQTANLVGGQPFSVVLTCDPGSHVQYGFETTGIDASPTNLPNLGSVVIAIQSGDPSVPTLASQSAVEGQSATFLIVPVGTAPFSYQWQQATATTTNILVNGGRISGATSNYLTIASVTPADAGTYSVTVTNSHGSGTSSALLAVQPLAIAQTNLLLDPSFESGVWAPASNLGWQNFNGAVFQNTGDFYYGSSTPVSVLNGTNCVQIYPTGGGSYNGVYQDQPALPGQIFTASGNFYTPSQDKISGGNICYMEVHFMDAAGNVLLDYSSYLVNSNTPADTWITLQPTNILAGDFVTPLGTSAYLKAPANTVKVRTQATYYSPAGAGGSVYVDLFDLRLRSPVVSTVANGSDVQLSFSTLYGPTYKVLYKTNLTDAAWQTLTTVLGDGTVKTVSDPAVSRTRFYTVDTQ